MTESHSEETGRDMSRQLITVPNLLEHKLLKHKHSTTPKC